MRRASGAAVAAALCLAATSLTGCGATVSDLPLPKPNVAGTGYLLHADFSDALNLPTNAHVEIGGTDVGTVTTIGEANFVADITMRIRKDISLPRGTTAELRQPTPLGDIYVALTLPEEHGQPMLRDGDTIDLDHTSAGASVEELMMSVSLLLNGGALTQAARIGSDLDTMVAGRGPQLSHLLTELTSVTAALNARTGQIDSALGGLDSLTQDLNQRKVELGRVADTLPPLIRLIAQNNTAISNVVNKVAVTMTALGDFTSTTGPQTVAMVRNIRKLLDGIAGMGTNLTGALGELNTLYPSFAATFKGNELAASVTINYLTLDQFTDPQGSRFPNLDDIPNFVGSLTQVIQRVIGRLQGAPTVGTTPAPPVRPRPAHRPKGAR